MKLTTEVVVKHNRIKSKLRGVHTKTEEATLKTAESIAHNYKARVRRGPRHDAGPAVYDSIAVHKAGGTGENDLTVEVGSFGAHGGRPVAKFLENGTAHSHAFPALRPATNIGRRELKKAVEQDIRNECNRDG